MLSRRYSRICYSSCLILLNGIATGALKSDSNEKSGESGVEKKTPSLRDGDFSHVGVDAHDDHSRNLVDENESCWEQLGNDIQSDNLGMNGDSIDLSSTSNNGVDGIQLTLAVGNFGDPSIFNYTYIDGNYDGEWTRLGETIGGPGLIDERFGESVSLSANGRILAVGAPKHKGNDGFENGRVQVYSFDSGSWNQLGQDIDGTIDGARFGTSVKLSDDGLTIICGTDSSNITPPPAKVFRYNGSTWRILGQPIGIDSTPISDLKPSVSISGDGTVVAVSSPAISMTQIFRFNEPKWEQIGSNITGVKVDDRAGISISLSSNGTDIAIGAMRFDSDNGNARNSGHTRIYRFSDSTQEWVQRGEDITGEAQGDNSGIVSLSDDALTVAIGAWNNDGNGSNSGHARVYRYKGGVWRQYGQDIDGVVEGGMAGTSISLSPDGQIVAIGDAAGQVRIFANTNERCPTSIPSHLPSTAPSHQPSQVPSFSPSKVPSQIPSRSPSRMPSQELTASPSRVPSQLPSMSPSKMPSQEPSASPSKVPSQKPSASSNKMPTSKSGVVAQESGVAAKSILVCFFPFVIVISFFN